jgi:hypothetical protein
MPPWFDSGQVPFLHSQAAWPADVRTASINETNGHLLRGGFDDWLADIGYRQPFCGVVEDNRAVSICAGVRIIDAVHAGHRRRDHLRRSRSGTYRAIPRLGATPFYGTSWDNEASQRVAARLHLVPIGDDFHVTLDTGIGEMSLLGHGLALRLRWQHVRCTPHR